MSVLLRGIRTASLLRGLSITQRANLTTKPARNALGPVESTVAFAVFAMTILAPSGWILANLESYKKKE